ncbi:MAG TPA: hypothetical protein VFF93_08815 [Luteimonas sp.]|nr:hypothetical protein [Luteimonas sp.]
MSFEGMRTRAPMDDHRCAGQNDRQQEIPMRFAATATLDHAITVTMPRLHGSPTLAVQG